MAGSVAAVVINVATELKTSLWWWAAVAAATTLVAIAAMWFNTRNARGTAASQLRVGQMVDNSTIQGANVQVGGDVNIDRDRHG